MKVGDMLLELYNAGDGSILAKGISLTDDEITQKKLVKAFCSYMNCKYENDEYDIISYNDEAKTIKVALRVYIEGDNVVFRHRRYRVYRNAISNNFCIDDIVVLDTDNNLIRDNDIVYPIFFALNNNNLIEED